MLLLSEPVPAVVAVVVVVELLSVDALWLALLLHELIPKANAAIATMLKNCFFIISKFVSAWQYKNETTAVLMENRQLAK
jgi:hypothetical protein